MGNKISIGTEVVMTKRIAKFYLEHPTIFEVPPTGEIRRTEEYNTTIMHSMLVLLGEDVIGEVQGTGLGDNVYRVKWKSSLGSHWAYYEYGIDFKLK